MSINLSRPSSGVGEDCDSLLGDNIDATPSRGVRRYQLQRSSLLSSSVDIDDTEAQAQMDLALNSNFDIGLFDYNWSDEPNSISVTTATPLHVSNDTASSDIFPGAKANNGDDVLSASFLNIHGANGILHPHAISSSAECPPIASTGTSLDAVNGASSPLSRSQNQNQGGLDLCAEPPSAVTSYRNQCRTSDWNTNPSMPALPGNSIPSEMAGNTMATGTLFLPNQGTQSMTTAPTPISSTEAAPPFLLFDAPVELRANFMASQRAHGFPTLDDNNSFHYRHQQPMQLKNFTPAVRLVDGRHGGIGSKRIKNEREQKRTQKITDLIDQLRDKMEEGGWKVGGTKSKYATLSTCAEFVKHLVQSNKEQELALEKTKRDLEAKRRKIEDETEYQQDPSEPESTTSSLTISSGSSMLHPVKPSSGETVDQNKCLSSRSDIPPFKKSKVSVRGSDDDCGNHLNEISSSNKGSSSEGTSSEGRDVRLVSDGKEEASNSSSSATSGSVSSVGAVARGSYNCTHVINHADVILKGRKHRHATGEATSLDESFKLDYEEVFIKSNVPQLIATTAGRIVAWNDIFLKASGLLTSDIEGLTFFSLVRQTELAKLFEVVAAALRSGTMDVGQLDSVRSGCEISDKLQAMRKVKASHATDYTAITLPCTTFRPRISNSSKRGKVVLDDLLYMTVTLMKDEDPKKRCFHCLFTDCPSTSGTFGPVTPDLLATLFNHRI